MNFRITDFASKASIDGTEQIPIAFGGANYKISTQQIVDRSGIQQYPTYASLTAAVAAGAFTLPRTVLVVADETNGGLRTFYAWNGVAITGTAGAVSAAGVSLSGGDVAMTVQSAVDDLSNFNMPMRSLNRVYASTFGVSTLTALLFGDSMTTTKWSTIGPQLNRAMGGTRQNMAPIPASNSASALAGNDCLPYNYVGGATWTKVDTRFDLWPTGQVVRLDDGDEVKWTTGGGSPKWTTANIFAFSDLGSGNLEIRAAGTLVATVTTLNAAIGLVNTVISQAYAQSEIRIKAVGGPVSVQSVNALDAGVSGVNQRNVGVGGLPLNLALYKATARANFAAYLAAVNADLIIFEMKEDTTYAVSTPLVFSGGGGTGAEGYILVNADGTLGSPVIVNCGKGYSSAPTVAVSAATGSGGVVTSTIANGVVSALSRTNAGTGYTTAGGTAPVATFAAALALYCGLLEANAPQADKHFFAGMPVGGSTTSGSDSYERANARTIKNYCNANRALGYCFLDSYHLMVSYANVLRLNWQKANPLANSGATDETHLSPDANSFVASVWYQASGFDSAIHGWSQRPVNAPNRASNFGSGSRFYGQYDDLYMEVVPSEVTGYSWDLNVQRDIGAKRQNGQRLNYFSRDGVSLLFAATMTKATLLATWNATTYASYMALISDLNGASSPGLVYASGGSWRKVSDNTVVT